jgi:poly(A) polymerase
LWPQVALAVRLEAAGDRPLCSGDGRDLAAQRGQLAIPRRYDGMIKEIWALHYASTSGGGNARIAC